MDQSQTAIEVKSIDDVSSKQIRAREITSLSRSPVANASSHAPEPKQSEKSREHIATEEPEIKQESAQDFHEPIEVDNSDRAGDNFAEPEPEIATEPEPEYNAWEVWTYLERQRMKTLKLLNTFQAEWEANRFVREAERSTPANLRIHYEVRPIVLGEMDDTGNEYSQAHDSQSAQVEYPDAIDVEIVTEAS
ncbi:hypothetical protein HCU40_00395 [Pseudanabaena biceps]|nr:hypothetical protein [Pseudanabaena biceps]